ncbi:STAS domain-containing protein [Streptomyces sp. WAC07061]|uniref:STAS domain-containing protein n=1 Tax=Streptomyces sp. WAC07061 TaxID=2487410 RepID=UPI0021AE8A94|nr:STAS domain-containing protein [Streptomyces sp. WAC07061]
MSVRRCGSSVLAGISGHLDENAGSDLHQALEDITGYEQDLMVDVHGMRSMDADGLLHLLDLHRRAELMGLRVLVVGWQPQPQQLMAQVAGIRGLHAATGERYALAGFRRLIEERAHRARNPARCTDTDT